MMLTSTTVRKKDDRISLVVTTYNSPAFLELVLKSVLDQRTLPREVVIADDGSTEETRLLIESYREKCPVPIVHSWIPDEGFRVAKARNEAKTVSLRAFCANSARLSRRATEAYATLQRIFTD
jgi:GT2 family glycosyltransferase